MKMAVNFTPRSHYPPSKNSSTQWMECWVGHRAGPDVLEKSKISWPCWYLNPWPSHLLACSVYSEVLASNLSLWKSYRQWRKTQRDSLKYATNGLLARLSKSFCIVIFCHSLAQCSWPLTLHTPSARCIIRRRDRCHLKSLNGLS
jgi:hypothetical protein